MITNPTPQRSLRGHQPQRPSHRTAISSGYVAQLATRLTERDRWLARMLYEHRVLTTHQIVEMAWPSVRAANLRLLRLYRWRLIDRFQPFVTYGTAPMHYVLDIAGASMLAREDGLELRDLNYRHDRATGIAYSLHLAHTVGTNGFFSALITRSRHPDTTGQLTAWWSETRCARHFGDIVRPDAYGLWHEHSPTPCAFEWFLEFDFGTERPDRLGRKLAGYAKLAATTGITTPVLVWVPTARREAPVRRALTAASANLDDPTLVPVATSSADFLDGQDNDPVAARWQPLDVRQPSTRRLRLAELNRAWPYLSPLGNPSNNPAQASGTVASDLLPLSPLPPGPSDRRPQR
ncbi:replication-relaxation family protein [Streptomyces phaeochromogenes]|uniref:replication-relaxation family protein n=1 Tax=Streptomyces phaeochromogenes TaxID=1923 RepID=UPI002DDC783A|nr:replication-relaxation family protein [Streptomyces phaeochromogenes]WRZ28659.1 replication-relaxation family protein [Streptomyces phaeochromogenes]